MTLAKPFEHRMAAHCETGTVAGLLNHAGLPLSEPMVLGLAGGIFFVYLEGKRLAFPTIATRTMPGQIRKGLASQKIATFTSKTFGNTAAAQKALDACLDKGIPAAMQLDMFYMDYIPSYMKAHFNGHFITAVGKEGSDYLVSDCYYPQIAKLPATSLDKARFALGDLAPKGLLFHTNKVNTSVDLRKAVVTGIKAACNGMLSIPIPFVGVKGIRRFADRIVTWPKLTLDEVALSHQVMMLNVNLEERGTGGAGFRYMYATFLQQAAREVNMPELEPLSKEMMAIGDTWREFSLLVARAGRDNDLGPAKFAEFKSVIHAQADAEESFFKRLRATI